MLDKNKQLEELANNKEFIEKLAKLESVEEVTAAINEAGVEVTVEEMERSLEYFDVNGDELNEDALEAVAGGIGPGAIIVGGLLIWSGVSFAIGCVHGLASYYKKKKKK